LEVNEKAKIEVKADMPTGVQKTPKKVGAQKRRRRALVLSFLIGFVLPSLLGAVYFLSYATDRYASGASFVVRGIDSTPQVDILGSFTGMASSGSTTSDSYIIRRYLESPDLLRELDNKLALQEHYSQPQIDIVSRFWSGQPFEYFVDYWLRRINTTYDNTTGIVSFEVQGFDPETTHALAQAVLQAADTLVNNLSEAARSDSVRFAQVEVDRSEERLSTAQAEISKFRSSNRSVDPTIDAQFEARLVSALEEQLSDLEARMEVMGTNLSEDSLVMQQMRSQAAALAAQIDQRRSAVGNGNTNDLGTSTAEELSKYESLLLVQTFAQQRYASALASLEQARMDADRQQRYLAVFSRPQLPEHPMYPRRIFDAFLFAAALLALWSILTLVIYAVRDHLK
jgi:capsular polysaccharide transport system permease protein